MSNGETNEIACRNKRFRKASLEVDFTFANHSLSATNGSIGRIIIVNKLYLIKWMRQDKKAMKQNMTYRNSAGIRCSLTGTSSGPAKHSCSKANIVNAAKVDDRIEMLPRASKEGGAWNP